MKILVTGGCGFIGANLVRYLLTKTGESVVNVDKLTYAASIESLRDLEGHPDYVMVRADIADAKAMSQVFQQHQPDAVIHLAAESHVDRSIDEPGVFVQTNIVGAFTLLQAALEYYNALPVARRQVFRFLHVSTDEVFGSLAPEAPAFTETTSYDPHSPYAASKASADHLARAWWKTFGLPVLLTNCSNNYGPYQHPEKLIPTVMIKALRGDPIPVYGDGGNVRDWLHVEDHVSGLYAVLTRGRVGEIYNIGANNEWRNLDLVREVCRQLDELVDDAPVGGFESRITLVDDRPGHDRRYAMDASKIREELGWKPTTTSDGFLATVRWYLEHEGWWRPILGESGKLERLGARPHIAR